MSGTWADSEDAVQHALERLADRYPVTVIKIVDTFDIAWSSWECDSCGALIERDGIPEIVITDKVGGDDRPDIEIVEGQLAEYRRLTAETERVLARYKELGGLEGDALTESLRRRHLEQIAKENGDE